MKTTNCLDCVKTRDFVRVSLCNFVDRSPRLKTIHAHHTNQHETNIECNLGFDTVRAEQNGIDFNEHVTQKSF